MPLRQGDHGELPAAVVIMTMGAGEVELALPLAEEATPCIDEGLQSGLVALNGKPARLAGDQGREGEQGLALAWGLRGPLMLGTAEVGAPGEVDRRSPLGIVGRIARGKALHALFGVAMAGGARSGSRAPERLAIQNPQHARVVRVAVLHGLGLGAHELVGRAALREGNLAT